MTDKARSFYTKSYLIPADTIKDSTELEVKFVIPGEMNGIFDLLRTMTDFDHSAALHSLSFDTGSFDQPFATDLNRYTLTVPSGTQSVELRAVPAHKNALVYCGDILIEDTLPRTVSLKENSTLVKLTVKAEDHVTQQEYSITIINAPAIQ
ncbi:Cadherin-like beta sandwich domain protein [compost metagenome]